MTVENKQALINALAKGDTGPLSNLVKVLGSSDQVMEFFANTLAISANGNPVKLEAAAVFLVGTEKLLKRIERQKEGAQILKTVNL